MSRNAFRITIRLILVSLLPFSVGASSAQNLQMTDEAEAAIAFYLRGANKQEIDYFSRFCNVNGFNTEDGKQLKAGLHCAANFPACELNSSIECTYKYEISNGTQSNILSHPFVAGHKETARDCTYFACCECADAILPPGITPEMMAAEDVKKRRKLRVAVLRARADCERILTDIVNLAQKINLVRTCEMLRKNEL